MENNVQGSSSPNYSNTLKNPSTSSSSPKDDDQPNSSNNSTANVMNNTSSFNRVVNGGQVTARTRISIILRNPIPPAPVGAPPAPGFSPSTSARILQLLAAENVTGNYEEILESVAWSIADFHPYLIDDNVITIPQSDQINITQLDEQIFISASADENWDHVDIPFDISDDQMSRETRENVFYDASSEEENGEDPDDRSFDFNTDDDMTLEGLFTLEAIYGLPEFIIMRQLRSEEYRSLASNPEHEESCRICLESFVDGDRTSKLDCGDRFHYTCISHWLSLKNVCPLCRRTGIYP